MGIGKSAKIEERGCFGKIGHKSKLSAEYAMDSFNGKRSAILEVYECEFCGCYHIGHNKKHELDKFNKKGKWKK